VLHGVASVVTNLTREPRRGSLGGGWWFQLRLAAEKRKKKIWRVGFFGKFFCWWFRNVLAYLLFIFEAQPVSCFSRKRREHRDLRCASAENEESIERRERTE
jgi:hypothetical protein